MVFLLSQSRHKSCRVLEFTGTLSLAEGLINTALLKVCVLTFFAVYLTHPLERWLNI